MVETLGLGISTIVIGLLVGRTAWALRRYEYAPLAGTESGDTPTISVCIAARNEVHALSQCLEHVLRSDYPKLEVLVLDDSSEDETPHIIRSFAHSGVRFIAGREIPVGWLGKNHAYHTLSQEASGEYLLFLDVDAALRPNTISQLMAQLLVSKRTMLSVLPLRLDSTRVSAIFGTLRYYWSIVLATKHTPPSASTLWMIRRDTLQELEKGLLDYGSSMRPEAHIARQLQRTKDYYYLIGTRSLGVSFEKRWHSQVATAMRIYYPIAGRSPQRILLSLVALLAIVSPLFVAFNAASQVTVLWAGVLTGLAFMSYAWFTIRTVGHSGVVLRLLIWPIIIMQEILLLLVSVYRYATNSVTWKGRAVQASPHNRSHLTIDE